MITRLCTIHLFIYLVVALSQPKFGRGGCGNSLLGHVITAQVHMVRDLYPF